MSGTIENEILRSLRRITRAIDLHSRRLASTFGLTGPQLVCLRAIAEQEQTSPTLLAREVSLSQGTVTGILDRLVARQLVQRERVERDRRIVSISVTPAGKALVEQAPSPLQERFLARFTALPSSQQQRLCQMLNQLVEMMGGEEIEAAPVLSTSSVAQSAEEIKDVIEAGVTDVSVVAEIAPELDEITSSINTSNKDKDS